MIQKGYFVITDITGYTSYLSASELDHAHEILQSLFEAQIHHLKPPFIISNFQGDAILSYIPEGHILNKQTILELIENVYYSFMEKRELMRMNTTCPCNACKNISGLDLKIFVHYGEFMIQQIMGRQELVGPDVIKVHRMMKNRVKEETGISAYALFTLDAARQLELETMCPKVVKYSDHYDELGEAEMLVHSLQAMWLREKEKNRNCVTREKAWVKSEFEVEVPPAFVWEFVTNAGYKKQWLGFLSVERTDTMGGRIMEGSSFHCAHAEMEFMYKMTDWKPLEYLTCHETGMNNLVYDKSYVITPIAKGTHFGCYVSYPEEGPAEETYEMIQAGWDATYGNLKVMVQEAFDKEKVTVYNALENMTSK